MNIYLKSSILTEIVILNQSLVAFIYHIGTVKPVLSRNITNQELIKDVNIIICING